MAGFSQPRSGRAKKVVSFDDSDPPGGLPAGMAGLSLDMAHIPKADTPAPGYVQKQRQPPSHSKANNNNNLKFKHAPLFNQNVASELRSRSATGSGPARSSSSSSAQAPISSLLPPVLPRGLGERNSGKAPATTPHLSPASSSSPSDLVHPSPASRTSFGTLGDSDNAARQHHHYPSLHSLSAPHHHHHQTDHDNSGGPSHQSSYRQEAQLQQLKRENAKLHLNNVRLQKDLQTCYRLGAPEQLTRQCEELKDQCERLRRDAATLRDLMTEIGGLVGGSGVVISSPEQVRAVPRSEGSAEESRPGKSLDLEKLAVEGHGGRNVWGSSDEVGQGGHEGVDADSVDDDGPGLEMIE